MNHNDGFSLTTKRLVIGHVTVCQGCCCGNTANGRPPVPVDWLKKEWRARGLLKRVQLTISGCLGPCDIPNIVTISDASGTQWLGEITEFTQYQAIVDLASHCHDAGELLPLPREFRHTDRQLVGLQHGKFGHAVLVGLDFDFLFYLAGPFPLQVGERNLGPRNRKIIPGVG
jgi:hypothetical protein